MRFPSLIPIALISAAALIEPRAADAQQPGFASVTGSVVDSVHGVVPLVGATIFPNPSAAERDSESTPREAERGALVAIRLEQLAESAS